MRLFFAGRDSMSHLKKGQAGVRFWKWNLRKDFTSRLSSRIAFQSQVELGREVLAVDGEVEVALNP